MYKGLILLVLLSFVYLFLHTLSPQAGQTNKKSHIEYGYINGISKECNLVKPQNQFSSNLHYFMKKTGGKTEIDFFCFDNSDLRNRGGAQNNK